MLENIAYVYTSPVGYVALKDEESLRKHLDMLGVWEKYDAVYQARINNFLIDGKLGSLIRIPNAMLICVSLDSLTSAKL